MIQYIAELNRVLITANSLSDRSGIERSILIQHCKSIAIEGRMPEHEDTIEFSITLDLLKSKRQKKVQLTDKGKTFLEFNPEEMYDLSDEQKKYIIRTFFLDGILQKQTRQCLKCFAASEEKGTFVWSAIDGIPFGDFEWVVTHLEQLGVINESPQGYQVRKKYSQTIGNFIAEPKGYTEEELLKWLEEKKRLGNLAEEIILIFEKTRLAEMGYMVEATCVKPVGKLKTNAGYDIESFNGKSIGMGFDRFIEVKGSGNPKLRFVWSQNEIKVAEKLGARYWIYYQGGINKKTGKTAFKPIMIQDPFNSLKGDVRLTTTPNGIIVEGSIKGETKTNYY